MLYTIKLRMMERRRENDRERVKVLDREIDLMMDL